MKAKNPTTEEEDVDGEILRGLVLRTSSQHKWSTLNSRTSPKNLNAENKKCMTLDSAHKKQVNSSFLSRFIELRSSHKSKQTMAVENRVDKRIIENYSATVESPEHLDILTAKESQEQDVVSENADDGDNSKAKDKMEERLSLKDADKNESIGGEPQEISSRENARISIVRDINDVKKLSAIHKVEELKRRLEDETAASKNSGPKLKNLDGAKQKIRESPPRRVSFKVRSGSNGSGTGLRVASSASSIATSRRATSALALADPRVTNKVAALASKFNAIILENKEEKSVEIIHGETKKKLLVIPSKRTPEPKLVITKRTVVVPSSGKAAAGHTKKHGDPTSTDETVKGMNGAKEGKRKTALAHRPSSLVTRSGNVKAAIQIFEQNATIIQTKKPANSPSSACGDFPPVKKGNSTKEPSQNNTAPSTEAIEKTETTAGASEPSPVNTLPASSQQSLKSVLRTKSASSFGAADDKSKTRQVQAFGEDKRKEPKYARVTFRRSATKLVEIALEEDEVSDNIAQRSETVKPSEVSDACVLEQETVPKPKTLSNSCSKSLLNECFNEPSSTREQVNEISDNNENKDGEIPVPTAMKPNKSFLWGTSTPATPLRSPEDLSINSYTAILATVTTEKSDNNVYDDVQTPASYHNYSTVVGEQDDIYDDVGPPSSRLELAAGNTFSPAEDDDETDGYDYCRGAAEELCYDDCEGEGYQCIGEDTESNIYDDVKSLSSALRAQAAATDDTTSISNCYESIYSGEAAASPQLDSAGGKRPGESSSASSSIGSGNQSYCDQSNSLYGVGGSASVSQASTVSADDGSHELLTYQLTSLGHPRSETSDEWVDLEMSDSDDEDEEQDYMRGGGTKPLCQSRSRSRRSPRWSRKVRKQWSKSPRKAEEGENGVFVSSPSVLYLGAPGSLEARDIKKDTPSVSNAAASLVSLRLTLYIGDVLECQEMTFFLEKEGDNSSDLENDHHYEMLSDVLGNPQNELEPYDDFDSFDSDESDETYIKPLHQDGFDVTNGRLPEPPSGQNIYGISKIAEAAGKKMLKLGQSLRKIRNKRNSTGTSLTAEHVTNQDCPPVPTTPRPSAATPPPVLSSRPEPPPRITGKSVSSSNLSGRKYWSLRKFKRSVSTTEHANPSTVAHTGPKKETATFYLTQALDADTGPVEKEAALNRRTIDVAELYSENSEDIPSGEIKSSGQKKQRPASSTEKRYSSAIRPNSPPPLPPSTALDNPKRPARKEKRNTSWYAECGLFEQTSDPNHTATESPKKNSLKQERPSSNSWYAEVGLWDMSTSSANDSSLSEQDTRSQHTDASGGETSSVTGSPENSGVVERRFADEPLYQFYNASVVERDIQGDFSDGYEEIGETSHKNLPSRPSAMELIRPREGRHRTLWCEIPEVINSSVLSTISPHQKKLQEAKFEIITSEASYVNSLNVLEKHFVSSPELCDESVLCKNDRRILFSNVIPVKASSEKFLAELEACWQDNILLHGICEVIYKHASNNFGVYVKYCSNQIYLDRTLRALKDQHGRFAEVLSQLETSSVCQSLSLHSFLMLPMQRITRLPLLIDAVLTRLDPQDEEYDTCRLALATLNKMNECRWQAAEACAECKQKLVRSMYKSCLNLDMAHQHLRLKTALFRQTGSKNVLKKENKKTDAVSSKKKDSAWINIAAEYNSSMHIVEQVVQDCNEGARRMERMEEILILSRQLDFPREVRAVPIISSSRWLVKAGEMTQLVWRGDEGKLTFGKKFSKVTLHMFLFTDLLFVTKKKSEECYMVMDYCPRNLVQMTSAEGMSHLPIKFTSDGGRNLLLLTMLQNHEKKTVEMILSCSLESDRQRWLEAVSPPISNNPDETVYEEWDCPQVTAIHAYIAQQPDELSLDIADVVNVLRKVSDGWYQGERIRDGERGWFPANYTIEIASAHVRARNLKQRYRLLALSGNFLESQRKEKQSK